MIEKVPISFIPYLKNVIWGGNKICSYKGIEQPEPNIGESWEISAVPGHESVVAEGPYKGLTIAELIDRYGASLLGKHIMDRYGGKFPLLVKLIDANDNLSVQVHPNDMLAMSRHGSLGKTEMWYIIDTEKDANIYSGLKASITPEVFESRVAQDAFEELLAVHKSAPGDVFFLPAGRVHAIGAGNLLAEIQESSDITYRIYDYKRRDANGNTRELHTELAKDAIDYNICPDYKSPKIPDDVSDAEIVRCDHFTVHRINVDGKKHLDFSPDSFTVIMCIQGNAILEYLSGNTSISKGETVLCPAVLTELSVAGKATLLTSQAN